MLDGFLLFTVLDVWGILLPLGLSVICTGATMWERLRATRHQTTRSLVLWDFAYRSTLTLTVMLLVVGVLVPWALDYRSLGHYMAGGPWCYEQIIGHIVGLFLLWHIKQQIDRQQVVHVFIVSAVVLTFLSAALFWIGRWDLMPNLETAQDGWFLSSIEECEWGRIFPKSVHFLFSALVTGGIVVVLFGMFGIFAGPSPLGQVEVDADRSVPRVVRIGVGWILAGLVPQVFIGPWLFLMLTGGSQGLLVEGTTLTSGVFFVSLTTALLALVLLNASFMAPYVRGLVWGGLANVAITLILMSIVRYETLVTTLTAQRLPVAVTELSWQHVLSVFVFVGLVVAILIRWCIWPSTMTNQPARVLAQLDKV